MTFKPNPIQLKHLADRGAHRYNAILKARQHGITTLYCIDYLDEAMWVPGITSAILADERENTDKIFAIVKRAFTNIHDDLKPVTKYDTKRMYEFTKRYDGRVLDSSIYVSLKARAGTVQRMHITESSRIKDRQELNSGSKQAVPKNGFITEETTANGFDQFYDFYMNYHDKVDIGDTDYLTHFYGWQENPDYSLPGAIVEDEKTEYEKETQQKFSLSDNQLLWRRWKIDELKMAQVGVGLNAEQQFKQEYPMTVLEAFQGGSGNVFDPEKVDAVVPWEPIKKIEGSEKIKGPNYFGLDPDNRKLVDDRNSHFVRLHAMGVWFWELPEHGAEYVVGVDPSDGIGADFSVVDVWKKEKTVDEKIPQVAQFYGKVRPDELSEIIADLARFYNDAFTGVENNMMSTILFLSKIYDNYYFTTEQDEKTFKRTKKLGWRTDTKSRNIMIDDFMILFDDGHLEIRSKLTLSEMKTFVKNDKGKREHSEGKHDDSLFAGFIAIQMRKLKPKPGRVLEQKPF